MRMTRILLAFVVLFALILDELYRMGRLHLWTWEGIAAAVAFSVALYDIGNLERK
jgi:hypothetical protein